MPRLKRFCPIGVPVHIIQRGNNRNRCFVSDDDMANYSRHLDEASSRYQVDIHAWVLMTNHVHLLVTPNLHEGVSNMMQYIGRYYVRYFNTKYSRTGTLWEGRFKSCLVEQEDYFLVCQRYIELNPIRADMVDDPADYRWSSYRANALGLDPNIRQPHEIYLSLGNSDRKRQAAYRSLFDGEIKRELINEIRFSSNKGLVLGSDKFKDKIEVLGGQRTRPPKRGPKAQTAN